MHLSRIAWRAWLCAAAMAIASSYTHADGGVVRLGSFVAQSDVIVIGVVSRVTPVGATTNGAHVALVDVQQRLKGEPGASIELAGDYRHPDDPMFVEGVRVLAFLRRSAPIGANAGIVEIVDDGAATQAATIVTRALRNEWAPANFQDVFLRSTMRVPRPLLASLLEELTAHLTPKDDALLAAAACDAGDRYLPAVRGWAIGQSGTRKVADARSCLEEVSLSGKDTRFVEEAVDALGDLGDARSVPVLLQFLDRAMPASQADAPRGGAGPLPGVVLALGKIGDANAVPTLLKLAQRGNNLPLHSAVIHALGLIGTPTVDAVLDTIGRTHPNPLIREQALTTLQRLELSHARRIR